MPVQKHIARIRCLELIPEVKATRRTKGSAAAMRIEVLKKDTGIRTEAVVSIGDTLDLNHRLLVGPLPNGELARDFDTLLRMIGFEECE